MYQIDSTPLGALKITATRSPGDTLTEEDVAAIVWAVARIGELEGESAEMRDLCNEAFGKLLPIYGDTENMETALLLDSLKLVSMRGGED